jgi:hypothetical protein
LTVPFWRSEGAAASILMGMCGLFWWVVRCGGGWKMFGVADVKSVVEREELNARFSASAVGG